MDKNKLNDMPKEVLNWRLWYSVFLFGLMGAARGLDEGLIGTTASQISFINRFGLKNPKLTADQQANLLSNITSMVQMGSILGAVIAFYLTDKIGRLWATRQLCLLWILGISIFLGSAKSGSLGMVYAGRFIAGMGIGQTTVVAPTYLAEIAPRAIRGLCVGIFSGAVYLAIMLGYFASWGSSIHISNTNQAQWVVPNSLHLIFCSIILTMSIFAIESPRWLIKVGRQEEAVQNLGKLRQLDPNHPYVSTEIINIQNQLGNEREATMGTSWFGPIRELLFIPENRYRLMLTVTAQLLSQWSGASSVTIYAPQYFAMMGRTGQSEKLFATAILGIVKLVSALVCAIFLIDFIGRKRALSLGIILQFISMVYMGIFLLVDKNVAVKGAQQSPSQRHAAIGAIFMIYLSGIGWALGWNTIQYLINSEIYPLRLRAMGGSIAMTLHFINQWGTSKAVPSMFLHLTNGGTMIFFASVTLIGLFWVWFFLPETSRLSLESIDRLFHLPWYLIGRKGREAIDRDAASSENAVGDLEKEDAYRAME